MELTVKAKLEVVKLNEKLVEIKLQVEKLRAKRDAQSDWQLKKLIQKEANREYDKQYKVETRIRVVQEQGYSTSEGASIKKEMRDMKTFSYDRSLGSRDVTVIGFSKVLQQYVKIRYTRWSGFMANVKGCAGMANTTSLNSVEVLTKEEYEVMLNQDRTTTVSFCGTQTTVLPALSKV